MKAYIIMQKGYEYDDSIYNETEGGSPNKVFFKKEDAKNSVNILEIKALKENDISHYSYDVKDVLNVSMDDFTTFTESLLQKYGKPEAKNYYDRLGEFQLHPMATQEESDKYLSMVGIRFYEVVECDVDQPSLRDHHIDSIIQ